MEECHENTHTGCQECQHLVGDLLVCELSCLDDPRQDVVLCYITRLLKVPLLLCDDVAADTAEVSADAIQSPVLLEGQAPYNPFWDHEMQAEEHEAPNLWSQQLEEGICNGVGF